MHLTIEDADRLMKLDRGSLYLSGTGITSKKNVRRLQDGDYVPGKYLFADNILTHVRSKKTIGSVTFYVGKISGHNVVSDGTYFAHCEKIRDGMADLMFKSAKDRGISQYENVKLDDSFTVDEAVTMYRVITGACRQGSQAFVDRLGGNLKERYTVREILELTKGQYGHGLFEKFFLNNCDSAT